MKNEKQTWNSRKSREFYNISGWGNGYFNINNAGEVTVKKNKYVRDRPLPITDIIADLKKDHNLPTPFILRFTDIIHSRALRIISAFNKVKKKLDYPANYTLIYPIKVNQNHAVVNSFLNLKNANRGLEAGSKAELLAILGLVKENKTPIICNGYKDREYIKIALIARKLGRNITIVIEKLHEARHVIELLQELDVTPILGVRFRLAMTLNSKWADSGGEKSKFGLNTTQALELVQLLQDNNLLSCLKLLHCHQGSQIANLNDIKHYIEELSMIYINLHKSNVMINTIDIGGGLAVDYEGSRTRNFNSTNYSLSEYATTILGTIANLSSQHNVPIPDIYSESGRAVVAHHAVFITNIIEVESVVGENVPDVKSRDEDLLELEDLFDRFNQLPINEIYSSSMAAIESIHSRFTSGEINIEKRAIAEQLFSHIKLKLIKKLNRSYRSHRELYDLLDSDLAKKIIGNFSLFQSLPDSWAIAQLFPILPLTHLNEEPTMRAIIEDITCDSDGKISNYMDYQGNEPSIKLPNYNENDPYLLAFFLIGAYQEIMGNMHNLFGPVTTIDISLDGKGSYIINKINKGYSNHDSLAHVGFDGNILATQFKRFLKRNKAKNYGELANIFANTLNSHPYLS